MRRTSSFRQLFGCVAPAVAADERVEKGAGSMLHGADVRDSPSMSSSTTLFTGAASLCSTSADSRAPADAAEQPLSTNQQQLAPLSAAAAAAHDEGLNSRYTQQCYINRGGQGLVVKAVDTLTGEDVAIKLIPRDTCREHSLGVVRELVNHAALQGHPHVVRMREVFCTGTQLALVMDYADGGDLAECLSRHVFETGHGMSEPAARHIFQQLVSAVDWMHRQGIASRDIKMDNILLHGSAKSVQLADFGWSCGDSRNGWCGSRVCGTPEYLAPEMLSRSMQLAQPADVWAAGVVLWALIGGGFAFLRPDEEALDRVGRMRVMYPRIAAGAHRPLPPGASSGLADLLRRMLEVDPQQRITMAEAARHPWVAFSQPLALASLNDRLAATALLGSRSRRGVLRQSDEQLRALVWAAAGRSEKVHTSKPASSGTCSGKSCCGGKTGGAAAAAGQATVPLSAAQRRGVVPQMRSPAAADEM